MTDKEQQLETSKQVIEGQLTMYDMAKQLVKNEVPMSKDVYNSKLKEIATKFKKLNYAMLLCRERNDYTVFKIMGAPRSNIIEELHQCLKNRGTVILMDEQPDGAWEIWIRDFMTSEDVAYYFFDYSMAVIDCNESFIQSE